MLTLHPVKACYLVANPCVSGILRMYQALAESRGVEVHVSYDIGESTEVLGFDPALLSTEPPSVSGQMCIRD